MYKLRPGKFSALTRVLEDYSDISVFPIQSLSNANYFHIDEIKEDLLTLEILVANKSQGGHSVNNEFLQNDLKMDQKIIFWFAQKFKPGWLEKCKKGFVSLRDLKNTDNETYQCLNNCGLFEEDADSQLLGQYLTALAYSVDKEKTFEDHLRLLQIGREGEELSYEYERVHSNAININKAYLENNDLGYDLEITLNKNKKFIEVKSSIKSLDYATASISRNQVITAQETEDHTQNNFYFHFWLIEKAQKKLAIISYAEIRDFFNKEISGTKLPIQEIKFNNFSSSFEIVQ
jgi:hypothetical protein